LVLSFTSIKSCIIEAVCSILDSLNRVTASGLKLNKLANQLFFGVEVITGDGGIGKSAF